MNETQELLALVREQGETIGELKSAVGRLAEKTSSLVKEIKALRTVVTQGATGVYPWSKLHRQRQREIEAVVGYLRQHPTVTITRAAGATWQGPVKGGYPSVASLACYCYSKKVYVYAV